MKDLRLLLALVFLPFLFIGLGIVYLFGIPFMLVGGKQTTAIFDGITKMIKD